MEYERMAALAMGIIVGIVICVLLFRKLNNDKRIKTEYDERQLQIRGRSYMFAFYGTIISEVLMICLSIGGVLKSLPIEEYIFHACSMYVGLLVLCVHSVWHGAYWGLNNNIRKYSVTFIVLFALNLFPFIGVIKNGVEIHNGYITNFPFINLFCIILMVVLAVTLLARKRVDNMESEREDCL